MTDDDRALLEFEDANPQRSVRKDNLIGQRFDLTSTRYYQRLLHLVTIREVIEAYPQMSSRIHRQRDAHLRASDTLSATPEG